MAEAIVCGAGTAGLAAAAALRGAGVEAIVLERSDRVAASWRSRYDGLRLNTSGFMCTQPGFRARRRRYGEFPSRDKWIEYLEDYAEHHKIDVRFGTEVKHLASTNGGWRVRTDRGELDARVVVIATGYDSEPNLPAWPGSDGFTGELIHSSAYRNPEPYVGRDVLVVGPGTTGSEIATLLSRGGAGRVRVACRTPPNVTKRKILGLSINVSWDLAQSRSDPRRRMRSRGGCSGSCSAISSRTGFPAHRTGSPQRHSSANKRRCMTVGSCAC